MPDLQADLFGGPIVPVPIVPGLTSARDIVTRAEEADLIAAIDAQALEPFRFQGWLGKRLTASFGWRYDFDDAKFAPADPMPAWLLPLRTRAADFAGLRADDLAQALLTRYDPGAGIGWHRDRPVFDQVIGISLGSEAVLRLRRRKPGGFDRATLPIAACSIYHLTGEARRDWEHGITPMDATRWSVTFRTLSARFQRGVGDG